MHVVVGRKEPSRRVRLAGLHQVLLLPRHDVPKLFHELGAVDHVVADRQIRPDGEVRHPNVEERQVVGIHEEGDARVSGPVEDLHGVRIQRLAQHLVEELGGADGEGEVEALVRPPLQGRLELLLPGHAGLELEPLARDLTLVHPVDDETEDPGPVLLPELHDAGIETRWVSLHPRLHIRTARESADALPGELPEEVEHVLEEEGLGAARAVVDRQPEEPERVADRQLTSKVQIHEFPARVVDVVQDPDRRVVPPLESLKELWTRMFAPVELQGSRTVLQLVQDPVAQALERLGLVHGLAHDLFERRILVEESLKHTMGFHGDRDAIELRDGGHGRLLLVGQEGSEPGPDGTHGGGPPGALAQSLF